MLRALLRSGLKYTRDLNGCILFLSILERDRLPVSKLIIFRKATGPTPFIFGSSKRYVRMTQEDLKVREVHAEQSHCTGP